MNIIVTGGAGYIGSHVCKELKKNEFNQILIDDLSGGYKKFVKWGPLEVANINSYKKINYILKKYKPKGIIHLAGKISVEDSFLNPNKYYYNNLDGSLNLIYCMQKNNIKKIIFSSSAAVYGKTKSSKIKENTNKMPISPYAHSKLIIEKTLEKYKKFHNFSFISLRYFNVAGADKNLEIGEAHFPETHLIPLTFDAFYKKKIFKV